MMSGGNNNGYLQELEKMFDLQKFGMKFGLENMQGILDKLDNPHQDLNMAHLAGTNGKGSIGSMLKSILRQTGAKIGFYTSPHLITFRERISVNEQMISEEDVLRLSRRIWQVCEPDSPPTFFEFVTAMAFLYFKEQSVDLAIIEAGLGGRLDSTNVINPQLSIISNISIEHTEQLGGNITAIATEKAGIIKPQKPLIIGPLQPEAAEVMIENAEKLHCPLYMMGRDFDVRLKSLDDSARPVFDYLDNFGIMKDLKSSLRGAYQANNAALAINAACILSPGIEESAIRTGLAQAVWPGRGEWFEAGQWPYQKPKAKVPLIMDGAHNPAGAQSFAELLLALKEKHFKCIHLIVGVMADKNIAGVLEPLIKCSNYLYLTRPEFSRAATPELLRDKLVEGLGPLTQVYKLYPNIPQALGAAAKKALDGDLVVLTGSLFTVGEARAHLTGINKVESN